MSSPSDALFNFIDHRLKVAADAGGLLQGRCEVFGGHDSGPKHLQGGRFGPEYNGEIHWFCPNLGDVRVRMHCPYGHTGPVMKICRPHMAMVQKRMAGRCTRCAQPPEQISLEERYYDTGHRYAMAQAAGDYHAVNMLAVHLADIQALMAELIERGIVKAVPLKLEEIA